MTTTTQLHRVTKFDYTDTVTILLSEKGNGAHCLGFGNRNFATFVPFFVCTDQFVDTMLNPGKFIIGDFLKMIKVEPK